MKRRHFLKGLAMGAAAGTALPTHSLSSLEVHRSGAGSQEQRQRNAPDEFTERFSNDARVRSGIALGGIGSGTIELRKDGRFYNWNIFNNYPKETGPAFTLPEDDQEDPMASNLFFKVRYEVEGEEPKIKLLQLPNSINEGGIMEIAYAFPWMEAISRIDYSARFPFARLRFSDDDMPFDIEMTAWTPFIPHDVKHSSLPLTFFDFTIKVKTSRPTHVMLVMAARNNVGYEAPERYYITNIRRATSGLTVSMECGGMSGEASSWGQIALSSLAGDSTYYCGWAALHPYYQQVLRDKTLPNIDDTNGVESIKGPIPPWMPPTHGRNRTDSKTGKMRIHDPLYCSLAASFVLAEVGSAAQHSFVYSWNFPNLYAEEAQRKISNIVEGHYYSNFFGTAFDVAEYAIAQRDSLLARSQKFQSHFFDSSADVFLLEQVNSHLNTFVTSGRLVKNGDFGILEGLSSTRSWGPIATMDVMLYGTAPIIALFPELQKATMRCHQRAQGPTGEIRHGLLKNFQVGQDSTAGVSHRLDLAGQYVMLVLRDFFWTNDRNYLQEMYPSLKKAINYILTCRSFDHNQIPIMRGIESSYDNFPMYGYAAYIVSQWLCAMRCAAEAAELMSDHEAQVQYRAILSRATESMDQKLWNGRYYRLYNDSDKSGGKGSESEACLTDQMVGQWMAYAAGVERLLPKGHIETALRNILQENYSAGFGLKNCSWQVTKYWHDMGPNIWDDQANTCWSGVELAFASFLLYSGFYDEALNVVRTVNDRYRKNGLYWTHQEFGGHYFRPMSSWAILNGLLGFSIHCGTLRIDPRLPKQSFKLFFATPTATAHFIQEPGESLLRCLTGTLMFSEIEIRGRFKGKAVLPHRLTVDSLQISPSGEPGFTNWQFGQSMSLNPGEEIALL